MVMSCASLCFGVRRAIHFAFPIDSRQVGLRDVLSEQVSFWRGTMRATGRVSRPNQKRRIGTAFALLITAAVRRRRDAPKYRRRSGIGTQRLLRAAPNNVTPNQDQANFMFGRSTKYGDL